MKVIACTQSTVLETANVLNEVDKIYDKATKDQKRVSLVDKSLSMFL